MAVPNIHDLGRFLADKFLSEERLNDEEEQEQRIRTCETCPNFNQNSRSCNICGCYMDVKTTLLSNLNPVKGRYEKTHCPLGKWGDLDIANYYRELDGKELLKLENDVQEKTQSECK